MMLFTLAIGAIFIASVWFLYRQFSLSGKRSDIVYGAAMAIGLPVLTLLGYLIIGNPAALHSKTNNDRLTNVPQNTTQHSRETLSVAQLQKAITALEAEIQITPNDVEKLSMLANSYLLSRRFADAVKTWEKVLRVDNSIEVLLSAADAHTAANGGAINNSAQQLILQALQRAPQHPQALWLAGMSAVQQGQLAAGKGYWQALHRQLASAPQQQQELTTLIQQLDEEIAHTAGNANDTTTIDSHANTVVTIALSLTPEAQANANATDTVFVFAKAANGPPAPLAVKRLTVGDLPTTIDLTEQDAMMPQMTIAQFAEIKLSAKVSKSGNPNDRDGDINSNEVLINQAQHTQNSSAEHIYELTIGQR